MDNIELSNNIDKPKSDNNELPDWKQLNYNKICKFAVTKDGSMLQYVNGDTNDYLKLRNFEHKYNTLERADGKKTIIFYDDICKFAEKKNGLIIKNVNGNTNSNVKTILYDAEFIERITNLSGIEKQKAHDLFYYFADINIKRTVTQEELIKLNKMIEDFYRESKR